MQKMMREGDWICNSCQHLNFKKRDSCHQCRCPMFGDGTDLPSYGINRMEVLPGDWYCNVISCGAHNYASRTSCYKCHASKNDYSGYGGSMMASGSCVYDGSGLPGWKSGDWLCPRLGCGTHNYANRVECFKCRTPKEFSG